MTWQPERIPPLLPNEFPALLAADGRTRYRYFATKLIDNGWACTWGDDSGAALWESDGHDTLPLWPHPDYAAAGHDTGSQVFYRLDHLPRGRALTGPHPDTIRPASAAIRAAIATVWSGLIMAPRRESRPRALVNREVRRSHRVA
ncbi:hypothetical protein, partial [Actinophytocola sp.]|uniref:hypothetical protein n=1 Tax=Actinophytocola sp. TaxID=1872138 RepID=UPI002D80CBF5